MGTCTEVQQSTDDQLLLLKRNQENVPEGSKEWRLLEQQINQIVAQNYLRYLNR